MERDNLGCLEPPGLERFYGPLPSSCPVPLKGRLSSVLQALPWLLFLLLLPACSSPPGGLSRPNGLVVAPDETLYVMDRGNYRVAHLSATGELLGAFGRLGSGPADIYSGWDIALDSAGNIYLCNLVFSEQGSYLVHDGVKVFTPDGRFLRELGGRDYAPNDGVQRHTPYGLDIDRQDRVYTADFGTNTVRVFEPQGRQVAEFFGEFGTEDGQFDGLVDVAVDDSRSLLYVADQFNSRIQQFQLSLDPSGVLTVTHRQTLGGYGREVGQFAYPQNLYVDDETGRLYVSDMANRRVQIFEAGGQPVTQLTAPQDWQVFGLDIGPDETIYMTDALNNAVWVFGLDGQPGRRLEVEP